MKASLPFAPAFWLLLLGAGCCWQQSFTAAQNC